MIVGGGASGTLLALRGATEWTNTDIYLVERSGVFGPGLAYSPGCADFLLNVPAAKMGALVEKPDHFYQWLRENEDKWRTLSDSFRNIEFHEKDFVPRLIYGAYLKDILSGAVQYSAQKGNAVHLLCDEVVTVSKTDNIDKPLEILTSGGLKITANAIVFATGNSFSKQYGQSSLNVLSSPYVPNFFERKLTENDHVIFLGSGLSMVDAACYLSKQHYRGKITVVSRHGLKPFPHTTETHSISAPFDAITRPEKPSMILNKVMKCVSTARKENIPWQSVIDSLRPFSNDLWTSLPAEMQKKLWRVLSWWNPARHRIPVVSDSCLRHMEDKGQLVFLKGSIATVVDHGKDVIVKLDDGSELKGSVAVHCLGFDYKARNIQSLCPAIMLETHWSGNLAASSHNSYKLCEDYPIYGLGPVLFGHYIESTAIPDIRQQAAYLAKFL